ncbi:hypothetical protein HK102_012179 [Quaeritorhiza haematococci]|nr:hypothetical protein HK102_012179 [Quaeritorhiza haematococci]
MRADPDASVINTVNNLDDGYECDDEGTEPGADSPPKALATAARPSTRPSITSTRSTRSLALATAARPSTTPSETSTRSTRSLALAAPRVKRRHRTLAIDVQIPLTFLSDEDAGDSSDCAESFQDLKRRWDRRSQNSKLEGVEPHELYRQDQQKPQRYFFHRIPANVDSGGGDRVPAALTPTAHIEPCRRLPSPPLTESMNTLTSSVPVQSNPPASSRSPSVPVKNASVLTQSTRATVELTSPHPTPPSTPLQPPNNDSDPAARMTFRQRQAAIASAIEMGRSMLGRIHVNVGGTQPRQAVMSESISSSFQHPQSRSQHAPRFIPTQHAQHGGPAPTVLVPVVAPQTETQQGPRPQAYVLYRLVPIPAALPPHSRVTSVSEIGYVRGGGEAGRSYGHP